jgi:hypothetical protein
LSLPVVYTYLDKNLKQLARSEGNEYTMQMRPPPVEAALALLKFAAAVEKQSPDNPKRLHPEKVAFIELTDYYGTCDPVPTDIALSTLPLICRSPERVQAVTKLFDKLNGNPNEDTAPVVCCS